MTCGNETSVNNPSNNANRHGSSQLAAPRPTPDSTAEAWVESAMRSLCQNDLSTQEKFTAFVRRAVRQFGARSVAKNARSRAAAGILCENFAKASICALDVQFGAQPAPPPSRPIRRQTVRAFQSKLCA